MGFVPDARVGALIWETKAPTIPSVSVLSPSHCDPETRNPNRLRFWNYSQYTPQGLKKASSPVFHSNFFKRTRDQSPKDVLHPPPRSLETMHRIA